MVLLRFNPINRLNFDQINDNCFNCLKMFREKVKSKCDEAKAYRQHNPLFSRENKEGSI